MLETVAGDFQPDQNWSEKNRILIIENSLFYASLIMNEVRQTFEGEIDLAYTFADLERLVGEHKEEYFLTLSNLVLPDVEEGKGVRYARENDIPTIVFTGSSDEEKITEYKSIGVTDYIIKESLSNLGLVSKLIKRLDQNRRVKALVVDDSSSFRFQMRKILEHQLFSVEEATHGGQAIEMVAEDPQIRLVITDYHMPKMNGYELVQKLRGIRNPKDLTIIGMSSDSEAKLAVNFMRYGADDFLHKPLSEEEFTTRVSMCMDKMDMLNELSVSATTDPLTRLWNRRYFHEQGPILLNTASKQSIPVSLATLDIDHFKRINDTYGHDAGDQVLTRISNKLFNSVRKSDLLARVGGEEFCLVAVDLDPEFREQFFDKLRNAISEEEFVFNGEKINVTASIGVTSNISKGIDHMLTTSDRALYQAKEQGRDRVIFAD
ncbi:diguanylate cyclase [Sneathiella sp. P13V-1]|uniref:diguanylate cyclase n=1 Tax=Sneathiella sp. P13V-1 TaxID=2697366 RepID=UPI00187BAE29|nr:diguanylate cyclase [Sneathiella sp. P13V-1]MBE7637705.1 diguanylate cyclase [Sneathiella sp. P13V-1]